MAFLTLASWLTVSLTVLFILFSVLLILVILAQKPKGGGLAGAFGGAGGGQSAVFGAKTGDVLTWATIIFFALFLGLGISLVFATRADHEEGPAVIAPADPVQESMIPDVPAPTQTPTPGTPATPGSSALPPAGVSPPAPAGPGVTAPPAVQPEAAPAPAEQPPATPTPAPQAPQN